MNISTFIIFLDLFLLGLNCSLARVDRPRFDDTTDQEALLAFKSDVTIDPSGVLSTWSQNTSMCSQWQGVVCNSNKTRVTGLSLKNFTLSGTIAPHIANLSFLRVLDLESNNFYGSIPVELGQLFRLNILNLATNNLGGKIPSSLGRCSRLQLIDLSENMLEGAIPSELGNLLTLQDLSFAKNNLTGIIPPSFGNLSSLNNLIFKSNSLHGSIPSEIGRLNLLLQLSLADNYFSGEIPNSLFNLSSLTILSLAKNSLSGQLPSNLFTALPNLTTLFMGGNLFHGHIPFSLSNATNLERLDFSTNQLTGQVPLLWNLRKIQILNLEINQLTSEGDHGLDFITSLTNSSFLQVFSLATNQFSGKLPSSIGNLSSQLSLLVLAENHFEGIIPEEIGELGGLTLLSLEFNSFTGAIPSTIGNLQNLQNLLLSLNFLSGPIPESLGNLTQLYELGLYSNNLTGTIPPTLSNCQHLQSLDLSMNGLNGKIPKEVFSFPSLGTAVNLSFNSLSGSLPFEIGNLKMVQVLDVSSNELSGSIPSTIGGCSNLLYLDMSSNSFEGVIPDSLASLKGIEFINLSSNNLSGEIPSLGTLQGLELLNLSGNKLQGEVPKQGIFLNTSGVFLTGNSELCGGIMNLELPKCAVTRSHSHKSKRILTAVLAASAAIVVLFLLTFSGLAFIKRKRQQTATETDVISFDGPLRLYSYYDLKSSTNDFSTDNLIGRGSFGFVYKGSFRDGTLAAIKVFDMNQKGASKSFIAECEAFRNIRHRNLVKITSACSTPSFKALVLQFMPNGSLEKWIHGEGGHSQQGRLSLKQRLEIAQDVAAAMEYLHHGCVNAVIHCDLKPSNVLLDQDMVAHVGDFGLARMFHGTASGCLVSSTIGLKGSIGYIAPEYGVGGQVSTKGDVYSYGIVLLEMLTGKAPTDEMFSGELNLQKWVKAAFPDRLTEILDNDLLDNKFGAIQLASVIGIGLSCASEAPEDRPEMIAVSPMIKKSMSMIFTDVA